MMTGSVDMFESLFEIIDNIFNIFETERNAQQRRSNTGSLEVGSAQLLVWSMPGGLQR